MIGKQIKGRGFKGVLQYIFGEKNESQDRATLLETSATEKDPILMSREFAKLKELNKKIDKPVKHFVISFKEGENPTDETMRKISKAYLKEMGFENCPFSVVKHEDTNCKHMHIVTSRIAYDGKTVTDSNERFKSIEILNRLSKEHGLFAVDLKTKTKSNYKPKKIWEDGKNKYNNKGVYKMNGSVNFGGKRSFRKSVQLDEADRKKIGEAGYPLNTIFKLMYQNYNYNFLNENEFWQLTRFNIEQDKRVLITKNEDRIEDFGDIINLKTKIGTNQTLAVAMMLKLAVAKNWETISLDGDEKFLKEAWKQADEMGLKVEIKPEQKELFKKFGKEHEFKNIKIDEKNTVKNTTENEPLKRRGLKL